MTLQLEGLLVAVVLLLPGFLTSRMIAARTRSVGEPRISALEMTLDSLLRSVFIHLIIAPIALVVLRFHLTRNHPLVLAYVLYSKGPKGYYDTLPVEVLHVLYIWLLLAFLIALFFGYQWDPINQLLLRLRTSAKNLRQDPFWIVTDRLAEIEQHRQESLQLWIQARLKNGSIYQGEYVFVGYRDQQESRELLLAHATRLPPPAVAADEPRLPPKYYEFVHIDVGNCESLDMLLASKAPSEKSNTNQD